MNGPSETSGQRYKHALRLTVTTAKVAEQASRRSRGREPTFESDQTILRSRTGPAIGGHALALQRSLSIRNVTGGALSASSLL